MARASERDEDFRGFVDARWLGLVRSAYLLVCDQGVAEDLVKQTLASVYPHWHRRVRDGTPVAYVHDAVVNRAVSVLRRSRVREALGGRWGDGSPTGEPQPTGGLHADATEDEAAVRALRELPPGMRAVIVLRYVDDLTEAATADLLGRSVRSVRRDTSVGLERLNVAMKAGPLAASAGRRQRVAAGEHPSFDLGPSREAHADTGMTAGEDVGRALLAGTEHLSVPSDAYARVMEAVAARRDRRQAAVAVAGIVSLAVAGVVGLAAVSTRDGPGVITPAPDRITERLRTDPFLDPEFDWPVRGNLATDAGFAAEFGRVFGADHRLLYAEDAEAGLVAVAVSSRGETVVFQGPADTAVADLTRSAGLSAGRRDITVAVPVSEGHLVIALMPESVRFAQISLPSVTRDGSIQRNWRQMPVEQGVARTVTADPVGALRLRSPVGDGGIHLVAGGFEEPGTLVCSRCDGSWVVGEGASQFRAAAAAVFGVSPEDVTSRLLLDAAVPAAGGRIVSYVAQRETRGLLRATYVVADLGGDDWNLWMVEPLRPLPANDAARPFVFTAQPSGDLVIVAPDTSRISFGPIGDAPPMPDVRLTNGVGFVGELPPDLASYRIFAYAPDGSLTRSWYGGVLHVEDPLEVRHHLGTQGSG
jgi:DNA-directed RNA polymerase specialized sigma24 family protein